MGRDYGARRGRRALILVEDLPVPFDRRVVRIVGGESVDFFRQVDDLEFLEDCAFEFQPADDKVA